ncbi:saccharopine dehydrogenase NADP-binding domain-containing protein [Nocardia sp. NBC_01503]|uniref:saccharopine dehydrogenase family protein n=1 Tax=Nocardia sp. NBC_01503 TaxID=2975997 RepID=UPI002E7B41C4|nr:saccharopine dehydrogenase NADP-binding domain-containing protein [Nocardia sp. NBC_01503]WTL31083.1 saccharopine dehydrogenase NADP-binding domain-containing protein [Nocardia sp. NBC_01503]
MRIAVYGATGFTGGLVVAELARRALTPVLIGRDGPRLQAAARAAGVPDAEIRIAELGESAALTAAFTDCAAVVNAAGPFTRWATPVIEAAIAAGAHYVDTSGEPHYLRTVFDTYGPAAARAGVAIVPAMADDGGPGDLIAALTAAPSGSQVDEVLIADLRRPGAVSRGTARTMAAVLSLETFEFTQGRWLAVEAAEPAPLTVPGEPDPVPVGVLTLPGVVTIPRRIPARRVRSVIRAEVAALFGALTAEVAESVPATLTDQERQASSWFMYAQATAVDGARTHGWVTGPDGYGLTAVIAVEAAVRLAAGDRAGVLSPAQAFDPRDFLDALTEHGVTWRVEQLAEIRSSR